MPKAWEPDKTQNNNSDFISSLTGNWAQLKTDLITITEYEASHYLVAVAHESPASVLRAEETIDQHGPAQREVEADVLLEVAAQLVTVKVIAETEALSRHHLIHLLLH